MGKAGAAVAAGVAVVACAVAAVVVGRRVRSRKKWKRVLGVLKEFEEACETSVGRLRQVVDAMAIEMHAGLASEGGSKLKMLLTCVDNLPNGSERGTYYVLHLEGTNFRVVRLQLGGQRSSILAQDVEQKPISDHLMAGTIEDLFDFLALSIDQFIEKEEKEGNGSKPSRIERRELGFTFPFPLKQSSVSSGVLVKWTKGFALHDMVNRDVAECLQQALDRKGLDIRVAVLVNDTVGTLALSHYHDPDTVAAVIIGTGSNACYLERTDAIIKCQGLVTSSGCMVVNMEWGNFWSSHLPRTSYDNELDDDMGFEKMITGRYLGDIVRRVILTMSQESDVFEPISSKLSKSFTLRTASMAAMHEDESLELTEVARILNEDLEIHNPPLKIRKLVVRLCDIVTRRAARLSAAGIVGILKKIGRDGSGGGGVTSGKSRNNVNMRRTVVAIEGDLYSSYPNFRKYLTEAMVDILGEEIAPYVVLREIQNGSSIGAAIVAASYSDVDSV